MKPHQEPSEVRGGALLRVATLLGPERSLGTAVLLSNAPGVSVCEATSLWALLELVRGGTVVAVVADPEQGEGWLIDTADRIVSQAQNLLPIILICRHAADVKLIEQRLGRPNVRVALQDALTPQLLSTIIAGMSAAHKMLPAS